MNNFNGILIIIVKRTNQPLYELIERLSINLDLLVGFIGPIKLSSTLEAHLKEARPYHGSEKREHSPLSIKGENRLG